MTDNESMVPRYFALGFGIVYIIIGIVGFVPALYTKPPVNAPHLDVTAGFGYLLGIFPVNVLHNVFHILVGLAGVLSGVTLRSARAYGRFLFLVFGILAVIGFVPQVNTIFGLLPIYGNDCWLHAATAILGGFFGWVAGETTNEAPAMQHA